MLIRDQLRQQVRDNTAARTDVTLGHLLDEWLSEHQVQETTRAGYRLLIEGFIRPALGATPLAQLCRQGPRPFEQLYAELRVCRRRCHGRAFVEHRTPRPHTCDKRCAAHVCKPLAASSVRQCHAVLSGALSAAKRWGWITVNPLDAAQRPRIPPPQPDPPSAEEATKIANSAWVQDSERGTFVWLTFITGARRGELVGLAWEHVDLVSGLLTIRRSLVRRNGKTILKDTKTQMRVIKLDHDTVSILIDHKECAQRRCAELGTTLDDDAFVFSYAPDHRRHCDPDAITHRYATMTADLGIDTYLHALRHYSATEGRCCRLRMACWAPWMFPGVWVVASRPFGCWDRPGGRARVPPHRAHAWVSAVSRFRSSPVESVAESSTSAMTCHNAERVALSCSTVTARRSKNGCGEGARVFTAPFLRHPTHAHARMFGEGLAIRRTSMAAPRPGHGSTSGCRPLPAWRAHPSHSRVGRTGQSRPTCPR
ncbi:MAG: hypothetical protein JO115_24410 [Pseudonocardiales bacterium]|nr:hypothetical protein [Pseudonocardiales bacterium]MBV9032514.1 hypothetical protein [Pseudonocardiales bacterium]MBV9144022.1 hypothetical protein [Pseudonocardiales bacterium]MBW0011209.1 hypothetical protein [Pseudonocardiales bacterium]